MSASAETPHTRKSFAGQRKSLLLPATSWEAGVSGSWINHPTSRLVCQVCCCPCDPLPPPVPTGKRQRVTLWHSSLWLWGFRDCLLVLTVNCKLSTGSVARGGGTNRVHRFGQSTAHRSENGRRNFSFRSQGNAGGPLGEFVSAVQPHAGFPEKLRRKAHVFGALHSPEPQLVFLPLQEIQRLFQSLHGAVKRGSQEVHIQRPGMPGIIRAKPHAILARLIAFNAAAIFIA